MINDKNIKLVQCPCCGKAFYIKTERQDDFELNCTYCEKEVLIKVDKHKQIDKKDDSS